jgi:hypothetical protein
MKRLKPVFSIEYELDVIQCDCGFHIGLDATFLDQVKEIQIECPSCEAIIDTDFDEEK